MIKTRTFLAAAITVISLAVLPAIANAQTADEVLDAVDDIVHHWQDGQVSAEEALEQIEELLHSIGASARTEILAAIDDVVHHAEDGEIEPEAAMVQIEEIVHGAGGAGHADPTPATTGNADLLTASPATGIATILGLAVLALALGAGRFLTGASARE